MTESDESERLGDVLAEIAEDKAVGAVDSVEAVREIRERDRGW